MEQWKNDVKQRTGWGSEIVEALRSPEEADVYIRAGLVEKRVNGKPALVQPNIDRNYVMPQWVVEQLGESWRGWTNADLMGEGYPPRDANGDPYELHHIGQLENSPLAELTYDQHHSDGNFAVLHTFDDYSDISRSDFDREKRAHWRARY